MSGHHHHFGSESYEEHQAAVDAAYAAPSAAAAAPAPVATHTQFLDLTNGEGGEPAPQSLVAPAGPSATAAAAAVAAAAANGGDDDDEGGMDVEAMLRLSSELEPSRTDGGAGSGVVDTSAPARLVEPGNEHTGRWTKEEHDAFLEGLQMYGKEWKKVAAKVKTRTVVQTRTHAQKYFQKLQKSMDGTMATASESKPRKIQQPRKKKLKRVPKQPPGSAAAAAAANAASGIKASRRSSAATMSAAQVISALSNAQTSPYEAAEEPARHGFSVPSDAAAAASRTSSSFASPFAAGGGWKSAAASSSMKIFAPDPNSERGKFPEPSPAATGKRKLAEIAAARMLAGVGSGFGDEGPPTPPPSASSGGGPLRLKDAPMPPLFGGRPIGAKSGGLSLQIVNPSSLGVTSSEKGRGDSPVTPWDGQLEALVGATTGNSSGSDDDNDKKMAASDANVDAQVRAIVMGSSTATEAKIHPVIGPATAYRRSALHQAVCEQDLQTLQSQLDALMTTATSPQSLEDRLASELQKLDEAGYGPLHSACAIHMIPTDDVARSSASNEIVRMLLAANADPTLADSKGNTPLHWAARAGDKDAVDQLVHKNAPLDARNANGETPLHWAMRIGMRGAAVVAVLLESGARPNILGKSFRRPIDVALEGFLDDEGSLASLKLRDTKGHRVSKELKKILKLTAADRRDARANLLIRSAHSRTLVLHHPECLEHHPKADTDWEAPDRVRTIMRRVLPSSDPTGVTETSGIFPYEVSVSQEFDRASLELLSRVHSTEYLSFVNKLSKDLEKKLKEGGGSIESSEHGFSGSPAHVVPFTPMVQRSMIKVDESSVKLGVHSDTSFSAGSLRAARRAAGAVQHAVDCVLVGRNRNAFCVVRPPGHHAGISGLLEGGESCGFCIFNNVAAGALHAVSDDRLLCNKCAIIDIDVHHGNGTEEIVRKSHDPSKLFFFSIHLYDNDKRKRSGNGNQYAYKFYPGTGSEDDLALNIINVPIVPLWKDPFGRIPAFPAKTHNTRKKVRAAGDTGDEESSETSTAAARMPSDVGSEAGSSTANMPSPSSRQPPVSLTSGRMAYRQAIQGRLLPALRAFNPDLILISAGFDAAKGDVGNARHERGRERMGLDLEPEDYAWTTRKILEIADICCQGRVVSVLEGGYGRTPPTAESEISDEQLQQLDRTLFGECAIRHLHAMIDPYNSENRFSAS